VIARALLVVVAAAVVVLLLMSRHDAQACRTARLDVLKTAGKVLPMSARPAAIQAVRDHCRGAAGLVAVAGVLHAEGRDREAQRIAQEAVDEEPDNATAWVGLAVTADAAGVPVTARRAARRALALSPLDPPPVRLGGASGP
jgi:Flp pilus assembly protein TadD